MSKGNNSTEELKIEYRTPYEQQCIITNLVAELAIVLNAKAKLENENVALKNECRELSQKLIECERNSKEEKTLLMENFKKSEEIIRENEKNLAKKDCQCLEQQRKYLLAVNDLKSSYYKYKDLSEKKEADLLNKIKLLKTKVVEAANGYAAIKELADVNQKKYAVYKSKVKLAMGVIKKLTAEMKRYEQKPLMDSKECQTTTTDKNLRDPPANPSLHCDLKSENAMLAELFFKQFSSGDQVDNVSCTKVEKGYCK